MGKSKAQGTRFETELVNYFTNVGFAAGRLAEGGRNDRGDILIHNDIDEQWVVEAKATKASHDRPRRFYCENCMMHLGAKAVPRW